MDITVKTSCIWINVLLQHYRVLFQRTYNNLNILYVHMKAKSDAHSCLVLVCFWPQKALYKLQKIFLIRLVCKGRSNNAPAKPLVSPSTYLWPLHYCYCRFFMYVTHVTKTNWQRCKKEKSSLSMMFPT